MPGFGRTTCWGLEAGIDGQQDLMSGNGEGSADPGARLRKHSVKLSGHSTSLSLEGVYWDALRSVAENSGLSVTRLIEQIDRQRSGNLSSAVRVYLLRYYQERAGIKPPEE